MNEHCPNLQPFIYIFPLCLQGEYGFLFSRLDQLLAHYMHCPLNHTQLSSLLASPLHVRGGRTKTEQGILKTAL